MKKFKSKKPYWPIMVVYKLIEPEPQERTRTMTRRYKSLDTFYADVKDKLNQRLKQQKVEKEATQYVNKLKKDAKIEKFLLESEFELDLL